MVYIYTMQCDIRKVSTGSDSTVWFIIICDTTHSYLKFVTELYQFKNLTAQKDTHNFYSHILYSILNYLMGV